MAGGLAGLGLGVGDRVLVLDPDVRRRYGLVSAVLWAGAAVVVPPVSLRPWEALAVAEGAAPRAIVFAPSQWPAVVGRRGLRSSPLRIVTGGPRLPGAIGLTELERAGPTEPRDVPTDAAALVSFTTGTAGRVGRVVRSHGVLRAQHDALVRLRGLADDDRDLVGLPNLVLHDLGIGVTSVLPPRDPASPRYGDQIVRSLTMTRATSAAGFPRLFEAAVLGTPPGSLGHLRAIHVGGSRVAPSLLRALARLAPAARVTVVYGSTEIEPIAAIEGSEYLDALASGDPSAGVCVGAVVPGIEVRLDALGPRAESMTPAAAGAILARGARVAGTPTADGWVATGDAGWLDAGGRLWLLGRVEDVSGGLRPFEVERTVEALDWVSRAALVRLDEALGSRGLVAVEPVDWGDAATRAERAEAVRRLVAGRAWSVDDVVLVRTMPVIRGPAGKVDAARLRGARRRDVRRRERQRRG
jgi:acyl-CoA synthetase (AMP-forming)/AMP-acid ligase II